MFVPFAFLTCLLCVAFAQRDDSNGGIKISFKSPVKQILQEEEVKAQRSLRVKTRSGKDDRDMTSLLLDTRRNAFLPSPIPNFRITTAFHTWSFFQSCLTLQGTQVSAITELLELPDKLLSKVFRYLSAPELATVGLVCRRLNAIASGNEDLWKWYCLRDFEVTEEQLWIGWSYKKYYTEALYKYRFAFGWWQRDITYYGGLMRMKIESGSFVAYECLPPLDDFHVEALVDADLVWVDEGSVYETTAFNQLRMIPIFAVEPRGSKMAVVCYQQKQYEMTTNMAHHPCVNATMSDHTCNDLCTAVIEKTSDGLHFHCPHKARHNLSHAYYLLLYHGIVPMREQDIEAVFKQFEEEEYEKLEEKFSAFENAACNSKFMPIYVQRTLPPAAEIQCAKPGIYSCKYWAYGWELINFRFSEDGKTFEGIKIKGDPNIPAGQFTVRVQLAKPVLLTPNDQLESIGTEKAIDRARPGWTGELSSVDRGQQSFHRPFWTPKDCHIWNEYVDLSKFFHVAYMCDIQVAYTGFVDPKIQEGLYYGFDDNNFGILWLEDLTFYRYYRATNVDDKSTF